MIEDAAWRKHCVAELQVSDTRLLLTGLNVIVASLKTRRRT
jgi:hypothetical protein